MTLDMEQQLFIDSGEAGRGHRINLLDGAFQEVGVGVENGLFQGYNATLLTQDFGSTGTGQFLTGVSYNDTDHNNFYSIGEGRNGVAVSVSGGGSTATAGAGGYSLAIGAGRQTVTFSGGGLASPVSVAVTISSGTNAKVDMVDQGTVTTSASLTDLSGATRIIGLGTIGLTLTGNASNETFSGTKGDDTIVGGGGVDTVLFSAAKSAYTITNLGNSEVQVAGPDGTDTLIGIDLLAFTDQTVDLTATANSSSNASHDFNGDGRSDILWRNTSGDTVLWNSNGAGGFTSQDLGVVSTDWRIADVGDFNGDGHSDILWRNASGDTVLWNSSAAGGYTSQDLGIVGTSWAVQRT